MESQCALCSADARHRCVCGRVWYCSKACQTQDWRRHRTDCDKVSLASLTDKGRALLATRRIHWGEEILREKPLLLINNRDQKDLVAWTDHVVGLVGELAESERRELEQLADNTGLADSVEFLYLRGVRGLRQVSGLTSTMISANSQECLRTLRIIRTNGINLQDDGETTGLYLRFSRINHSCAPSAVRNIEPTSGLIRVIAARDIEKGEEITIKVGQLSI